jgi:hypothetical protein
MFYQKRFMRLAAGLAAAAAVVVYQSRDYFAAPRDSGTHQRAWSALGSLAPAFIENRGQADPHIRYYAAGSRYTFQLTRDAALLTFLKDPANGTDGGVVLAMRFTGANPRVVLEAQTPVPGEVNYLRGNDPSGWRTGLSRHAEVVYRDLWPRIDLVMRGEPGALKYEFRIRPGGRVSDIRIDYAGADGLAIDNEGALEIKTAMGVLRDSPPVAWQGDGLMRVPVDSRYVLSHTGHGYSFAVGDMDLVDRELVIDPGLEYSTFLGGSSHDFGDGIAVDGAGNAYVVGTTQSTNFPTRTGSFDRTFNGGVVDVFVTKINPTGTALVYSTYLGGTPAAVPAGGSDPFEFGRAIAVDAAGNAYVAGQTTSANFPTTSGAFDRSLNVGTFDATDAFVTKLNATGSGLVYSTFIGGTDIDDALAIAVDGSGQAHVGGQTGSTNFPTTAGAFDRVKGGAFDAFVVKLNATGSALLYSTFIGGTEVEYVADITVAGGSAYVVGPTRSPNFPTTAGAYDTTLNGEFDGFVTRLNPTGSALVFSTFLGGSEFDSAEGVVVDAAGDVYVSGGAGSFDFPTTPGAFDTTPDGSDAFVTKLNAFGSALLFSTVIGGSNGEGASGLAIDASFNLWITGGTSSADFPVSPDAFDASFNGVADAFVTALNGNGTAIVYSSFIGGPASDVGRDIAVDAGGAAYITGQTISTDFPTTQGAFDTIFNGDPEIFWADGFVAKFGSGPTPPVNGPGVPAAPPLESPFNGETMPQPVTFHWNFTTNAATFQIQIDDSSAFTPPLVHDQSSITDTRVAVSGFAGGVQHFWRVRGINSSGVAGPFSVVRNFTAGASPEASVLGSLDANPATVVGGEASSGTAVLSTPAPQGGAVISLSSSHPAVASVPATTTAPSNSFTASFTITTFAVTSSTTVTITGHYNGSTRTATLTVTPGGSTPPPPPPPPPAATLQSVSVSPTSVTGGSSSQGTVFLSAGAPAGGASVSLSSGHAAVSVPPSVIVAAGAASATFTASTTAVTAATPVTIAAAYGSNTRTTTLTVNPTAQSSTLTVTASGRSGERVTSTPTGISVNVGTTGSASFATGTSITLRVTNSRDAIWSGACSSGGNKTKTCTFTLNASAKVSANVQ